MPTLGACVKQQLNQFPQDRQGANAAQPQLAQNPLPQGKQLVSQQGTITAPPPNSEATLGQVVAPKPNEIDPPKNQSEDPSLAPLNEKRFTAPPALPLNPGVPRVAILLPLSGQHAKLGQVMLNAAQMALFHFA
ncbi:MAG: hypothetical protein QF605_06360, partial [Rhodospirillales bacterium]|nr:hypothetical protein [Rhodospirillales bacterium]